MRIPAIYVIDLEILNIIRVKVIYADMTIPISVEVRFCKAFTINFVDSITAKVLGIRCVFYSDLNSLKYNLRQIFCSVGLLALNFPSSYVDGQHGLDVNTDNIDLLQILDQICR